MYWSSTSSRCQWCGRYCSCPTTTATYTMTSPWRETTWETYTVNEPMFDASLPKAEHESIIQMRRIRLFGGRRAHPRPRAQRGYGRIIAAPLPRQKLRRWKSLKEKRQAWGIA